MTRLSTVPVILMLCFVVSPGVSALEPKELPLQYGIDVWDAKNGLSAYAIHSIVQTHDGYLWLATDIGLIRFDGVRFKIFNSENTKELGTNDISTLAEDHDGNLWIGTKNSGLCKLSKGSFTLYDTTSGLAGNDVYALYVDSQNVLWVGLGNALAKCENGVLTVVMRTTVPVASFYEDSSRTLWAGESVLFRKEGSGESFTSYPPRENSLLSMTQDNAGYFWIGRVSGLYHFDGASAGRFVWNSVEVSMQDR